MVTAGESMYTSRAALTMYTWRHNKPNCIYYVNTEELVVLCSRHAHACITYQVWSMMICCSIDFSSVSTLSWGWLLLLADTRHGSNNTRVNQQMSN